MSECRLWADDPVNELSTVLELPELPRSCSRNHRPVNGDSLCAALDAPLTILGVPFHSVTLPDALARIEQMIGSRRPHYVVTANVDFLVQAREDVELHRILLEADLVLCDGQPLVWISRWLGKPLPQRVAGSDLVPDLIRLAAAKGHRIFFLGGTPHVAARAVANIQSAYPGVKVCGFYSPEFGPLLEMEHEQIVERIRKARPDLLFVSLGCPKAEKWMSMHYRSLGVPVAMGVGATIDFLAEKMKRAPQWMRRSGTEWVFRLGQEPRRLFTRYFKDARQFSQAIATQLWQLHSRRHQEAPCAPATVIVREPTWQRLRMPEILCRKQVERDAQIWRNAIGQHCLLEMQQVRFIDSIGIGLLIELHRQLLRQDRCLVLLEPTDVVRRAIRLMRLDHFFLIASDAMEASAIIRARAQQKRRVTALSAHATLPLIWQGEITAANSHNFWAGAETQIDSFADYREPITIDLSGVSFIDSTGVGLLLRVQRHAAAKGAQVHFINPQPAVLNVLRIARLEQALLSLNGSNDHRLNDSRISRFNAWRERGFAWQHLSRARS